MNVMTNVRQEEDFERLQSEYLAYLKQLYASKKDGKNIKDEISKIENRWTKIGILDKNGNVVCNIKPSYSIE